MTVDIVSARNAFYDWAAQHFVTVWAMQSAPRPLLPYITLDLNMVGSGEGLPNKRYISGSSWSYSKDRQFTLTVILFSDESDFSSQADIIDLRNSLETDTVLGEFRAVGLALESIGPLNDLTTVIDSKYERRYQFDVTFHGAMVVIDNPDYIDKVEINDQVIQ